MPKAQTKGVEGGRARAKDERSTSNAQRPTSNGKKGPRSRGAEGSSEGQGQGIERSTFNVQRPTSNEKPIQPINAPILHSKLKIQN
jgi:hypothetical protein